MRIVHLSSGVSSSSANTRLHKALIRQGMDSMIVTLEIKGNINNAIYYKPTCYEKIVNKIRWKWDSVFSSKFYHVLNGMPFADGKIGYHVDQMKELAEADIIHIHWICNFLNLKTLKRIMKMGKPVVITMHDNWMMTGGCHVRLGCDKYINNCGKCYELSSNRKHDKSYRLIKKKKALFKDIQNICIISPSKWMDDNVSKSPLLGEKKHIIIPNTIDIDVFAPKDVKYENKGEIHILCGSMGFVESPYKGYDYLVSAIETLKRIVAEKKPDMKIVLHIFGSQSAVNEENVVYHGFISNEEEMAKLYSMVDVYVVPSLEDSFNQTVVEALACETPVVSFATGGIVDIIEHKENGYLAEYKNSNELAKGIMWVIENNNNNILGKNGRRKVEKEYAYEVIAQKYERLYSDMISDNMQGVS